MGRFLIYCVFVVFLALVLCALASIFLLPSSVQISREIRLPKTREEVFLFLDKSDYFHLWQPFESPALGTLQYRFQNEREEAGDVWRSVKVENAAGIVQAQWEKTTRKNIDSLQEKITLAGEPSPFSISFSLHDIADTPNATLLHIHYVMPIKTHWSDLFWSTWVRLWHFYEAHTYMENMGEKITDALSKISVPVPVKANFYEREVSPKFWIYVRDTIHGIHANMDNMIVRQPNFVWNTHDKFCTLTRRFSTWAPDSFFVRTQIAERIFATYVDVGTLVDIDKITNIDSLFLPADLHVQPLEVRKQYGLIFHAFPKDATRMRDSFVHYFPVVGVAHRATFSFDVVYASERKQKNAYRVRQHIVNFNKY